MSKQTPINKEFTFDGRVIISQTDLKGIITYANRKFSEVSGYTVKELVGQPHNIIRHPDMPKALFQRVWETIKGGQAWTGLLKNMRKDGTYYWVDAEILPILDENMQVVGYISARKAASRKDVKENEEIYSKMLETQA
ncbi:MAG: PAS domain-containing protein [Sulfurimonadaceae bacterium]|jgi:aerotaxis receptor|nr:PAS domain-containing protein [Sulfurimonadaceae bacterium]